MFSRLIYAPATLELQLWFRNGRGLGYRGVTQAVWDRIVALSESGGSFGKFYNSEIKGRYLSVWNLGDDVEPESGGSLQ